MKITLTKAQLKEIIRQELSENFFDFLKKKTPQEKAQDELQRLKKLMGAESGKDSDLVWKNHLRDKLNIEETWRDYLSTQKWRTRDPDAKDKFAAKLLEVIEEEIGKLK